MHYKEYKKILSPKNGMNLYRGCTHGCIYCDSRSTCYQITHKFEDIEVKSNAIEILEEQLKKKRNKCMIGTGAMCDPYIHLEEELELTRQSLQLFDKYGFGASVLTKSDRILRDLDLIKSINEKTKFVVQMTLTTYDDELCKVIEPYVSVTSERVEVLNIMRDNNIPTVVWLGPILPFINDSVENLKGLLDYCIKAEVKAIMNFGFGVTLREGDREYFYKQLDKEFPNMKEKYMSTYGNAYSCSCPNSKELWKIFKEVCDEHNIIYRPKDVFAYLNKFEESQEQLSLF